jgi:hypothetical protein
MFYRTPTNVSRRLVEELRTPYFRGVFTKDKLPNRPWQYEVVVVQLDDTNWACFRKIDDFVEYYSPSGGSPPMELLHYLRGNHITWNDKATDNVDLNLCFLFLLNKRCVF